MKQATSTKPTGNPGNSEHEIPGDRPQGQFRVRAGDLVEVTDRHSPRPYLAQITGFYRLGRSVYARLTLPPGGVGTIRMSTKVRNVTRAWRQVRRAPRNSQEG